jgi:CDP-2,3-bis-(O-geranylgeranyl)-sn-glycerol synthase
MPDIIQFLAVCFYFLFPAYAANIAPILANRFHVFPRLALPIDCNVTFIFDGKRLLGPRKTVRGFLLGTLAAMFVASMQSFLWPFFPFPTLGLVNYASVNPLLLGFLLGFGSLVGDSVGSFIKRRIGWEPGRSFLGLDQVDMLIAVIFVASWKYHVSAIAIVTLLVGTFIWHLVLSWGAYKLRIRDEKW